MTQEVDYNQSKMQMLLIFTLKMRREDGRETATTENVIT